MPEQSAHLDSLQAHSMTIFYMKNYDNWQAPPNFYFWKRLCNHMHSIFVSAEPLFATLYMKRVLEFGRHYIKLTLELPKMWKNGKCLHMNLKRNGIFHTLGALDRKHISMEGGSSSFYNYKGFHSLVLLAICDARYCFSFVDIGGYGSDNDASILSNSRIYDVFDCNRLCIPESESVNGVDLPYVLVADEIFPLKPWLMKPFPGKEKPLEKEIFNYRLSRCRRIIENTFGILTAKWHVFTHPIKADPLYVEMIMKAGVCLHNYLRLTENAHYIPDGFMDSENDSGNVHPGDWRAIVTGDTSALVNIGRVGSNNYSVEAKDVRENYFNSPSGSVSWQYRCVTSCGDMLHR